MKRKISKILVCVDLSEYTPVTLEYARAFVLDPEAEIILFNVINLRDINGVEMLNMYYPGYYPDNVTPQDYVEKMEKERSEQLDQLIQDHFPDGKIKVRKKIDVGVPFESILRAVESEEIDLVVMANKGRGNIARVLFGSVAEKVFRHCPVPVVSVRRKSGEIQNR